MTKTIYIHLHQTRDEQKHAPAGSPKGGQFVSSGGASSAKEAATYHSKKQGEHGTQSQRKDKKEAEQIAHEKASYHHGEAAEYYTTAAVTPKSDRLHGSSLILGEYHANKAKEHEGSIGSDLTKHPQYTKADYEYLKGKGWDDLKIKQRWDEEHQKGLPAQKINKHNPPSVTG